MKKPKVIIYYDLFVPWIYEDYGSDDLLEAWSSGETPEDNALNIAGMIPIQHIKNWKEIKHYYDEQPYNGTKINPHTEKLYASWSEYYEDDGYVETLPEQLDEVEWDYTEDYYEVVDELL